MSEDRQHQATCDWNLYPEDRATDPHLCNLGCLDRPEEIAASWRHALSPNDG